MRYASRLLPITRAKLCLVVLTLPLAAMAEQTTRGMSPQDIPFWTWVFIAFFANLGWAVAELDKLADLLVNDGRPRREYVRALLKFVQTWLASGLAAIGVYFIAKSSPGWLGFQDEVPEMLALLGVAAGGYGGVQTLEWLKLRLFGASQGAVR